MKYINILENDIGECNITSKSNIPIANEYAIRSLARLQILLMSSNDINKTKEIIKILKNSTNEIREIYV